MVDDEHAGGGLVPDPALVLLLLPFLTLAPIAAALELTKMRYLDRFPENQDVQLLLFCGELFAIHQT